MLRPMAVASLSDSVSPTTPRMSYSRSIVGWKLCVMGHPLGERRRSGGGEQVSVRMQPLARRKVQSAHRLAKFLPRDDVADSHAAQMRLVEQGEASREKLADRKSTRLN